MLCVNVYAGNGQIISIQKNGNVSIPVKGIRVGPIFRNGKIRQCRVNESRFSNKAFSKNEIRSRRHFVRALPYSALVEFQRGNENWPKNNSAIYSFASRMSNIVISPIHTFTRVNGIIYSNNVFSSFTNTKTIRFFRSGFCLFD